MIRPSHLKLACLVLGVALGCLIGPNTLAQATPDYPQPGASNEQSNIYLPFVSRGLDQPGTGEPGYCLSAKEMELAQEINQYRISVGLPAAPLSRSLTMVGQYHVIDLQTYSPNSGTDSRGQSCNMHSWSSHGFWTPVCYTSDHAYASGMWYKPREITRGIYDDIGYEIAARWWGSDYSAAEILNIWKRSSGHNDVIIEQGDWSGHRWPAMGVGISENYAVVWFGDTTDPQGTISTCP